jgi:hypothetical protein
MPVAPLSSIASEDHASEQGENLSPLEFHGQRIRATAVTGIVVRQDVLRAYDGFDYD